MPLWKFYHPENAFSDGDKTAIAQQITALYSDILPPFYFGIIFEAVPKNSFYIGGKQTDDFVRISVDHIAKQLKEEKAKQSFLAVVTHVLAPYVAERGLRWEMHVDETPFDLWTIQGIRPPVPGTPESEKWRKEGGPSAY